MSKIRRKNHGNMVRCQQKLMHHVRPRKMTQLFGLKVDPDTLEALEYRSRVIHHEAEQVLVRLQQIRTIAESGRSGALEEILIILNEQFEYGHTLPDSEG